MRFQKICLTGTAAHLGADAADRVEAERERPATGLPGVALAGRRAGTFSFVRAKERLVIAACALVAAYQTHVESILFRAGREAGLRVRFEYVRLEREENTFDRKGISIFQRWRCGGKIESCCRRHCLTPVAHRHNIYGARST